MKKVFKRVFTGFMAATMLVSLAACSPEAKDSKKSADNSKSTSTKKETKKADPNKTEIVYWGDWGGQGQKQFEYMLDKFNESQDKISAKYELQQDMITKFLTASVSGKAPDIMFWDRWRTSLYAPKNVLHPIDELMSRDKVNADDFYSEAIKELTNDGKLYGLPLTVDNRCLFYNKTLLEEKGIKPPTNWDELRAAAKALTEWDGDKLVRAGLSLKDTGLFNMWVQQAGGSMVSEDGKKTTFNNEAGKTVLNFWKQLMFEDKVYKVGFETGLGEGIDAFATGKVAMIYTGPWMLDTYKKYGKDLDFGVIAPPAGPNGDKGGIVGGFGLVIPEKAKHKEESWELMKWWLAVPENAVMYSKMSLNIPGVKAATEDSFYSGDDLYNPFLEAFEFSTVRPPFPQYSNMECKALIPQLELFMEGKLTIEEALDKAQELGDKILVEKVK